MMDSAGTKTTLDDLEPTALAQHHARYGHTNVMEREMAVAVRRIIIAVDLKHTVNGNAGSISRDKDNRLLPVRVLVVGITLAHNDVDAASRVTSATGPPLLTVKNVLIALATDAEFNVGGVRGSDLRLRHKEG